MALTTGQRDTVARAFNRIGTGQSSAFTRATLRTAVDDADNWADTNASSYNTALNATFRTNATAEQKALLLALVCWLRANQGLSQGD